MNYSLKAYAKDTACIIAASLCLGAIPGFWLGIRFTSSQAKQVYKSEIEYISNKNGDNVEALKADLRLLASGMSPSKEDDRTSVVVALRNGH